MKLINDKILLEYMCDDDLNKIVNYFLSEISKKPNKRYTADSFSYPIDKDIIDRLCKLKNLCNNSYNIYKSAKDINELCLDVIKKSIQCLRFFDNREPYQPITNKNKNKKPIAYGIAKLESFFQSYADFEGLLFGSDKLYRDHVIHIFRTWLLGIFLLTQKVSPKSGEKKYYSELIKIEGVEDRDKDEMLEFSKKINFFEIISMWSISSLCHDLGYPLEKAEKILYKTENMMRYFVSHPQFIMNLSSGGVQDLINEYIVKLMSSKMVKVKSDYYGSGEIFYSGRIQPKYYMKFSKSLEKYSHGIVSSIILYKTILYFMESDYNINEDYYFKKEDARQFYIRREIIRSMASHSCPEIYHLSNKTLSFLLVICDEIQEWDRRKWADFYTGIVLPERIVKINFMDSKIVAKETISIKDSTLLKSLLSRLFSKYYYYRTIFRDGQDTSKRNFDFIKRYIIKDEKNFDTKINFNIPSKTVSIIDGSIPKSIYDDESNEIKKWIKDEIGAKCESNPDSNYYTFELKGTERNKYD